MSVYHHLQPSFTGGQISRRLQSRVDTAVYGIAAAEITNMVPAVEGPLMKRPGTRWRATALASASWLSTFVFNATQAYVLVWSEGKLRFLTNDALLTVAGTPVEVDVPYSAAEAPQVWAQQSYDVIRLAHENHPPGRLARTAADSFSYSALALTIEPFDTVNSNQSLTVSASGATGSVTLTASADLFLAGHVGSQIRIEADDFADVQAWQPGIDGITVGTLRRSEGKVYQAASAGRTGNVQPIHTNGTYWDGSAGTDINSKGPYGVQWTYVHDRFGIAKITAVASATSATATVIRRLPGDVTSGGSYRWSLALWSAAKGWPQLVTIFRGRLCFIKDNIFAASVLGDYSDFSEFNEEGERSSDMGFVRTIDSPDRPLWCRVDGQNLVVGTSQGEFVITAQNSSEIFSGANIRIDPQHWHGGVVIPPEQIGNELLFIQRGRRKVRAMSYSLERDRYGARDLLLYARQFGRPGIKQLAYQAETEELLWALRDDGTVAAHPYNPAQDVKGWSLGIAMDGASVLSIAAVPSTDGSRDDLWLLVDRDGTRTIEQLGKWWDEDEGLDKGQAYHLDGGLTYDGAATDTIDGLNHLAGLAVAALADGVLLTGLTVAEDGSVTLDREAALVQVGRLFTARAVTLPPEIAQRDGTSIGRRKRLVKLVLRLIDSLAVRAGSKTGILDRVLKRQPSDPMGSSPALRTGTFLHDAAGNFGDDDEGAATLEDRSPWPWILPAIVSRIETGDK